MKRGLIFLVMLAIWAADVRADGASALRTLTTGDDSKGWRAVGRLNIGENSFCTGSLIAPDLVLTAAHCLYDMDTGARIGDSEVQFLADWRGGRAAAYRGIRRSIVHPGFLGAGENFVDRVAYDVAILELDQPIRRASITPFAIEPHPSNGSDVRVVSYAHNRADSPSLQDLCQVLAHHGESLVLNCDVDFGSSGAPVFVMQNGEVRIVSLVSAKARVKGQPVALGTPLQAPLQDLMALRAQADGVFHKAPPVVRQMTMGETQSVTGAKFLRP